MGTQAVHGRVLAGMATMPSRSATAPDTIRRLAVQVDHLYLFLDGFTRIPDYARLPNVEILRSQDHGALGAAGKLLGALQGAPRDLYLFVDDDVLLPPDFARRVAAALRGPFADALVGFHGSRLLPGLRSYRRDRRVTELAHWVPRARRVDVVATCAGGFRCGRLAVDVRTWPHHNMVDLQLALEARARGMDAVLLPRRWRWIRFAAQAQEDSIYRNLLRDDSVQSELARRLLAQPPLRP